MFRLIAFASMIIGLCAGRGRQPTSVHSFFVSLTCHILREYLLFRHTLRRCESLIVLTLRLFSAAFIIRWFSFHFQNFLHVSWHPVPGVLSVHPSHGHPVLCLLKAMSVLPFCRVVRAQERGVIRFKRKHYL